MFPHSLSFVFLYFNLPSVASRHAPRSIYSLCLSPSSGFPAWVCISNLCCRAATPLICMRPFYRYCSLHPGLKKARFPPAPTRLVTSFSLVSPFPLLFLRFSPPPRAPPPLCFKGLTPYSLGSWCPSPFLPPSLSLTWGCSFVRSVGRGRRDGLCIGAGLMPATCTRRSCALDQKAGPSLRAHFHPFGSADHRGRYCVQPLHTALIGRAHSFCDT